MKMCMHNAQHKHVIDLSILVTFAKLGGRDEKQGKGKEMVVSAVSPRLLFMRTLKSGKGKSQSRCLPS